MRTTSLYSALVMSVFGARAAVVARSTSEQPEESMSLVPGTLSIITGGVLDVDHPYQPSSVAGLRLISQALSDSENVSVIAASTTKSSNVYLISSNAPPPSQYPGTSLVSLLVSNPSSFSRGLCLTYDPNPEAFTIMTASPCTHDASPHVSQLFLYDPKTTLIGPLFGIIKTDKPDFETPASSHAAQEVKADAQGVGSHEVPEDENIAAVFGDSCFSMFFNRDGVARGEDLVDEENMFSYMESADMIVIFTPSLSA